VLAPDGLTGHPVERTTSSVEVLERAAPAEPRANHQPDTPGRARQPIEQVLLGDRVSNSRDLLLGAVPGESAEVGAGASHAVSFDLHHIVILPKSPTKVHFKLRLIFDTLFHSLSCTPPASPCRI